MRIDSFLGVSPTVNFRRLFTKLAKGNNNSTWICLNREMVEALQNDKSAKPISKEGYKGVEWDTKEKLLYSEFEDNCYIVVQIKADGVFFEAPKSFGEVEYIVCLEMNEVAGEE